MARSFNGTSDKIDCGASAIIVNGLSFSFAAWARSSNWSAGGATKIIMAQGQIGSGSFQWFGYDASAAQIGVTLDGSTTFVRDTVTGIPTANLWYHIAATWNTGTKNAILYTNGVSRGNTVIDVAAIGQLTTNDNIKIGCGINSNVFFNGSVADAAWWNVELTAAEVAALAKGFRPKDIRPPSLVRYWPLDGLASPEPELSGSAKNGTVTGAAAAPGPPTAMFMPQRGLLIEVAATSFPQSLTATRYDNTSTFYAAAVTSSITLAPALFTEDNTFYAPAVSGGVLAALWQSHPLIATVGMLMGLQPGG